MTASQFTILTGVSAVAKWVYEYTRKLKWEKNKFLLERIDIYKKKESVQKMHLLLDWNEILIDFDGERKMINDDDLLEALVTHDLKNKFTTTEVKLRGIFDDYFDSFYELVLLSEIGLIDAKNLRLLLKYWIEIIDGKKNNKPDEFVFKIKKYMRFYGYNELLNFIEK
jgi:hypothetical protein